MLELEDRLVINLKNGIGENMKTLLRNILFVVLILSSFSNVAQAQGRGTINVNQEVDVLVQKLEVARKASIDFKDGFYKVESLNDYSDEVEYDMLVQTDVNDSQKKLIVLIPERVRKGKESGFGYFYQARPVSRGRSLMLSPISIGQNGNFIIESERSSSAPVLLLSKSMFNGEEKNTFTMQGRNGALGNGVFTIKKMGSKQKYPKLSSTPRSGFFAAGSKKRGAELIVNDGMLSLFDGSRIDQEYEMIDLNEHEIFSGLALSQWDSMAEYEVSYENIQKLAVFFKNYQGEQEFLLIASPGFREGQYRMDVYQSGNVSWIKKLIINLFE